MNLNNISENIQQITEEQKHEIKQHPDFTEEKFYRFKFRW